MTTRSGRHYSTARDIMMDQHGAEGGMTAGERSEGHGGGTGTMELMLRALLEDRTRRDEERREEWERRDRELAEERERRDRELAEERRRREEEMGLLRGLLEGTQRRGEAAAARRGLDGVKLTKLTSSRE